MRRDNLTATARFVCTLGCRLTREICVIFAILEKRQSLFPYYLGSSDHPHTVVSHRFQSCAAQAN